MRLLPLFCLLPIAAWCQKPVITSVVNAASFQPANTSSQLGVGLPSGGGLVTIFGTNLAMCTQAAASTPLPTEICGTAVEGAPLLYVSPSQINFQWPSGPASYPVSLTRCL